MDHHQGPRIDIRYTLINQKEKYDEALFDKLCLAIYYQREIRLHLNSEQTLQYVRLTRACVRE